MKREHAERLWPTIKAYAEGAEIERFEAPEAEWKPAPNPTFAFEFSWRVKPKREPAEAVIWVDENGMPIVLSSFDEVGTIQREYTTKLFREVIE